MPPAPEQQNPLPSTPISPSNSIKFIRVFLLVLIVLGLGLIATQSFWVPQVVSAILQYQEATPKTEIFKKNGPVNAPRESQAEFETISKDNMHVYFGSTIYSPADPKTFQFIDAPKSMWFRDANHVYYYSQREDQLVEVDSIDTATFQCIGDCTYAKDRATVFYALQSVNEADPATFQVITRADLFDAAKDKNHIFAQGQVVEKIAPDGTILKPLGFNSLYSDGQRILQGNAVISDDAAHFQRVQLHESSFLCAKDSKQFYLCSNQSSEIDPIKGSDPSSFTILIYSDSTHSLYGKDNNLVYYFGEPAGLPAPNVTLVQEADAASFSLAVGQTAYDAQDKNHTYYQGQVMQ